MYKVTKMNVRDDCKHNNEDLLEENIKRAEKYRELGLISGGSWRVLEGDYDHL